MLFKKKAASILAAGVLSLGMVVPTLAATNVNALGNTGVKVWKSFGEGHNEEFTGMGKHAEDSFNSLDLNEYGSLDRVYTNHLDLTIGSGYIESLSIYGPKNDIHHSKKIDDNGEIRTFTYAPIKPTENAQTGETYFKGKAKIKLKVIVTKHKDKVVFLQPK